ncbi:H/ACA ribonucleoprotein complex non-core subunit NAF1 [Oopsacas minuta]|uniref:H/ACA ribonucleoprotein complex non-core subunit NAF1 n=1 Tax=Oopsacas minuta TaxID=111878 RepID=A0AAV7JRS9_9METZ|nr:H/ACA ribonucleoprotein complex non-core subunit NAF1 [Oopsacas minuta]
MSRKKKGQFMEETQAAFGSDCVVVSEKTTSTHAPLGRSSSFSLFTGGLMSLTSKMSKGSNSPRKSPTKLKFPPLPQNEVQSSLNEMNNSPKQISPTKQKPTTPKSHTSLGRKLSASILSTFSSQTSPAHNHPQLYTSSHRNYSSSSSSSSSSSDSDSSSSSESDTDVEDRLDEEKIETSRPNDYRLAQEKKLAIDLSSVVLEEGVQLTKFSCVSNLMDTIVILASTPGTPPLDAETRVFTSDRKCIGVVYETFGPVKQPFYSILFDSPQAIRAMGIKIGQPLYCSPADSQLTQFVFLKDVKKGSDASWIDDNEPPAEAVEFSDDETEQKERAERKAVSRANKQSNTGASHFNSPLSNSNGNQETIYSPMDVHNQQVPPNPEVMDTHFTNPNTQSPLKKNLNFILPPSQPQISSAPYSCNQLNIVPSEQQGIFPIPTDTTDTSLCTDNRLNIIPSGQQGIFPIPTDTTDTSLCTDNQLNIIPSEQQGIFLIPTDTTDTSLSTDNQLNIIPSEQQGIFPIPTDTIDTSLCTDNQLNIIPSEQQGIFPIPTDTTDTSLCTDNQLNIIPSEPQGIFPIPTDTTDTSLCTDNQLNIIPSEQQGIFTIPTDTTDTSLCTDNQRNITPSEQQGISPIPTDTTDTSLCTDNQLNIFPSEQQVISPIPTDTTDTSLCTDNQLNIIPSEPQGIFTIPTDSTDTSLCTDNQLNIIPSEPQGIFLIPTDTTDTSLCTDNQLNIIPSEQQGIFSIPTDATDTDN